MPDIDRQTSAMRSRLKQQLREKDRIERLLEDDAATPKDLEDILSAIEVIEGQIEAQESGLGNTIASLEGQIASARNRILQIEDQLAKCRIASPVDGTARWPGMPMQESSQSAASRCSGWLIPVQ